MLLSLEKKHTHTTNNSKTSKKQQQHIVVPVNITGRDAIRQWL